MTMNPMPNRDSNPYKSSDLTNQEQKMGNYHKVDKGELFIQEGMTVITEVDSDMYLDVAARRRRAKANDGLYPNQENYPERLED